MGPQKSAKKCKIPLYIFYITHYSRHMSHDGTEFWLVFARKRGECETGSLGGSGEYPASIVWTACAQVWGAYFTGSRETPGPTRRQRGLFMNHRVAHNRLGNSSMCVPASAAEVASGPMRIGVRRLERSKRRVAERIV
jgi:hypothetical protein